MYKNNGKILYHSNVDCQGKVLPFGVFSLSKLYIFHAETTAFTYYYIAFAVVWCSLDVFYVTQRYIFRRGFRRTVEVAWIT